MNEMNFDLDDTMLSSTEELGGGTLDDTTGTFGASHNLFSSGFDVDHPLPSYEELRNAGFSDYLARNISEGGIHSYSERELFHVLYESEDPVAAYNEMMDAKAQHVMDKADALINDIENSGLLGNSFATYIDGDISIDDDTSHYNEIYATSIDDDDTSHHNDILSPNDPRDGQELGVADCWPLCKALTGVVSNNADYGFHA